MSVLEHLPHEISTEILSYLSCSDLASTSTLSRHMHDLSEPVLYKSPSLMASDRTGPPVLRLFLRTLASEGGETRASYVRSIHVELEKPIEWWDEDTGTSEHTRDMALLGATASLFELRKSAVTQQGQLVLLLHLLPRLQILDITPHMDTDIMFWELIESTAHFGPVLGQLRELRCYSDHTYGGISPGTLLALLRLPCIRKIEVRINDGPNLKCHTAEAVPGISGVTTLHVTKTTTSLPSLAFILTIPSVLTHLSYFGVLPGSDFNANLALQPLRSTLQYLRLRFTGTQLTISSLRDWPVLRTVQCCLTLLLGKGRKKDTPCLAELLPAGLHEFTILRDRSWSIAEEVAQGVELLRHKEEAVPRLVTLGVVMSRPGRKREVRLQNRLRVACEGAGVALKNCKLH